MSRFGKKFGRRILAYLLSGAMIMSNMTAFASEPSKDTGGGYYYEELTDVDFTDAENVEETEADESSKSEDRDSDKKDDVKETSTESAEAAETEGSEKTIEEKASNVEETTEEETSDNEQTSETESFSSTEIESEEADSEAAESEAVETETEDEEESSKEKASEVTEKDKDVKAEATVTYTSTYDFRDGSIVPKDTDGKGTVTSSDGKLTVACGPSNAYGYNGVQHGTAFKTGNTITIHVLGKAEVFIGGCKYSKGSLKVTNGEEEIATFSSTSVDTCYDSDKTKGWSFTYEGGETDLVLTFGTAETYVPVITVKRTEPKEMITYTSTYDFRDGSIVPKDTDGKGTVTSSDGKLTVACGPSNAYGYNGVQHGTAFKTGNTITIHVLGKAGVFIGGCKYSKGSLKVTNGEEEIATFSSTSVDTCYDSDKTKGWSFTYEGDETDLVLTFGTAETYVPIITVERTEPKPDVTAVKAKVTLNDPKNLLQEGDTVVLKNRENEEDIVDITSAKEGAAEFTLDINATYDLVSSNSDIAAATSDGKASISTTIEDFELIVDLTATVVNPTVTISEADAVKGTEYALALTNQNDGTEKLELKDGETVKLKIGASYKLDCSNANVEAAINGNVILKVTEDLAEITVAVTTADMTHHTYDVWDFGAEILQNTDLITYNNLLTADIINGWFPGKEPGSKLSDKEDPLTADGEDLDVGNGLKLICNGNAKKWRLRGLTSNTAISSEQNESKLEDELGNLYKGIMYDNAGNGKMWMTLEVKAGDKVKAIVSSNGTASTITWESPSGEDKQTFEFTRGSRTKLENTVVFTAAEDGAYKLYTPNEKLVVARIYRERPASAKVSGAVVLPAGAEWAADSQLLFTNQSTGVQTEAAVTASSGAISYTVDLLEQYTYDVSVEGIEGCVVGEKNKLSLPNETGSKEFDVELISVDLVEVTGSLADLTPEAAAKLKLTFTNKDKVYVPKITIDAEKAAYSGKFEKDVEYTLKASNVNDYTLDSETFKAESSGSTIDIKFTKKPTYAINVTLEGPTAEEAAKTILTFTNIDEEGYEYTYTATADIALRNGQYAVKAVLEGYTQKVTSDVKVNGAAVDKTIIMISNAASSQEVPYKEVLKVGSGNENDYESINDALDAVRRMKRENDERVTILIAPGDYEEMLVVDVPNITLKNASANPSIALKNKGVDIDENAVRITSYYGHGYTYYSMGEDCKWDADILAANKENGYPSFQNPGSGTTKGSYWNATVVITAGGFQAEGIIFENSFNQYVSKKAAEDIIVTQGNAAKEDKNAPRADMEQGDTKVQEKAYVERAAALAIYKNVSQSYFDNCKFVGRQDTLYGGENSTAAFYKCSVYGGTDYIFGGMKAVFAKCDLVFNTMETSTDVGYITAAQQGSGRGYLMYNCHVTSTTPGEDTASEFTSKPGYFGRPWSRDTGEAVFFYTVIDEADAHWQEQFGKSLIMPAGWNSSLSGESALSQEYGTYEKAEGVDNHEARVSWATVLSEPKLDGKPITVAKFLDKWNPFEGKDMSIEAGSTKLDEPYDALDWLSDITFKEVPVLKKDGADAITSLYVGDTLTVSYALDLTEGEQDSSVIAWYRVTDSTEVPVNTSDGNTYTITSEDVGCKIRVTVTPATSLGRTAEAASDTTDVNVGIDTPVASIASGTTVEAGTGITFICVTEGVDIYYTTDGSEPTAEQGTKYDGTAVVIDKSMTIKVIAVKGGYKSAVGEYVYTVPSNVIDVTTIDINDCDIAVSSILEDTKKNPENMPKTSVVYVVKTADGRETDKITFAEGLDYAVSKPVLKEGKVWSVTLTGLDRTVDEYKIDSKSSITKTFKVFNSKEDKDSIIDLSKAKITLDGTEKGAVYTGYAQRPAVTKVIVGKEEVAQTKYKVSYKSNINAGKASVIISANSDDAVYGENDKFIVGTKTVTFTIKKAALNKTDQITVTAKDRDGNDINGNSYEYRGADAVEIETLSVEAVKSGKNKVLRQGVDYTLTYKNNRKAGKATATIKGIGNNVSGTVNIQYTIKPLEVDPDNDKYAPLYGFEYSPKGAKAQYIVLLRYKNNVLYDRILLEEGVDFKGTYKYSSKSKEAGSTVEFSGNGMNAFKGAFKAENYEIKPAYFDGGVYVSSAIIVDATKGVPQEAALQKALEKAVVLKDYFGTTLKVNKDYKVEPTVVNGRGAVLITPVDAIKANYIETNPVLAYYYDTAVNIAKMSKPKLEFAKSFVKYYDGRNPVELTADDIRQLGDYKLELGRDVEIVEGSYKNNYKAGTASVTIRGISKSGYYGTMTIKFKVVEA